MASIVVLYPLAIWLGQGRIEPRLLAGLLILAALTRLHTLKVSGAGYGWLGGTLMLAAAALWTNAALPLKLYPVLVNAAMLAIFGYSLIYPPSIAERFARIREPDLSPQAVRYTRRVTQVWCAFFIANGAVALGTALWGSPAVWTLYNGFLAYLLMGLLFAGEFCVRWRFKARYDA